MSRMDEIRELIEQADYCEGLALAYENEVRNGSEYYSHELILSMREKAGKALEDALFLSCKK